MAFECFETRVVPDIRTFLIAGTTCQISGWPDSWISGWISFFKIQNFLTNDAIFQFNKKKYEPFQYVENKSQIVTKNKAGFVEN